MRNEGAMRLEIKAEARCNAGSKYFANFSNTFLLSRGVYYFLNAPRRREMRETKSFM